MPRYIRPGGARSYYLASDVNLDDPLRWEELPLTVEMLEVVKARARWLGRERDRNLPMAQRSRFLYDAISR